MQFRLATCTLLRWQLSHESSLRQFARLMEKSQFICVLQAISLNSLRGRHKMYTQVGADVFAGLLCDVRAK